MKKIFAVLGFTAVCAFASAQQYDALDKYWLPQECSFNMQDASLKFSENATKNVTVGEIFDVLFKGKALTLTKLSLLSNSKVTTVESESDIRNFDILSPVKISSGSAVQFDVADFLISIEGTVNGKTFDNVLLYVCNASGAAEKSMYRNVTVLSDMLGKGDYSTKNFLVSYDFQKREDAEKRFKEICAPVLAKVNESADGISDSEFMLLENRNPNLLYKTGMNFTEFDQNRDAIAAFLGGYKRLCAELKSKGYNDVEKMRFSMKLASEIAGNYLKIGKPEMAYQYLYHAQNMGRQLNEYKYVLAYVKSLNDIDKATVASRLASEMKSKGLDITDANTYKALMAIK